MTDIKFDDDQVMAAIEPYFQRVLLASSHEGRRILRERRGALLYDALRNLGAQWLGRRKARNSAAVERYYSDSYAAALASINDGYAPNGPTKFYRLGSDRLIGMSMLGLLSAYLAAMVAAIAALQPRSVCEVGFGTGKNLFYLAPRFPKIAFSGFELTASGVATARAIQSLPSLPPHFDQWIGRSDLSASTVIRSIDFQQGNAAALPAADKSVDVAMTMLALEQMADILPRALSEIHRITRRHVVFLEPFREANDIPGFLHLKSRNYFRAGEREIAAAGFRPLTMISNLPNKLTFGAAMLVAEVV